MTKVTYDKLLKQKLLHQHQIEDIAGLTNPLRFQGEITTDFDSLIISGLDNGWLYTIKTTPSGQTVTDTNTGQVFKDKDEIAWDGTKWVIVGNESEIDPSKWTNIDVQFDKGLLYNGFNSSFVDILPSGFSIPSLSAWNDLITTAGGAETAGQRLKSLLGWTSVYPGDTNNLNFNATGTGVRVTAEFIGESQTTYFLASDTNGAENGCVIFRYDIPNAIALTAVAGGIPRTHGFSIRGVRGATAEELLLADGTSAGVVKDYDGNYYRTVKIGFNVWMADNLKTTHENDGTPLVQVQDQTAWAALTSPAYCYYNNTDIVILDTIKSNYIEPINNRKFSKSHIYDYTETPTSLANTIIMDATRGDDATADGSIAKPYKTPSKVIDSYIYQTILGYVTSGSPNVTGVSDVDIAKVKIGDKVKFSGMTTYGHTVISITLSVDNNTIVTNTNFAVSSGVELIVYTEKLVKAFGTFNIDASIEKDGVFWDFSGATCIIGNATAFNITSAKNSDFVVKGGRFVKTHANSKIISNSTNQLGSLFYSGNIDLEATVERFSSYYIRTDKNIHSNLFVFENSTNIGNIDGSYSFNPTTKINRATVTGNVVITLPTYPSTQSVSVMLKLTQGTGGGFDVTFADAVNLSQFVFTDGAEGQRTWVTLLWDGEEWCFTASAWKNAI
jgi:uncharacterized protein (TIGR02145 family)